MHNILSLFGQSIYGDINFFGNIAKKYYDLMDIPKPNEYPGFGKGFPTEKKVATVNKT